ncbi:hypothetical protein VNI00_012810 [Paramarasmius palmivorus]|uniref:Arylamine N-acetyltransferase n=1 Tax=Paramarasmius palmivorus TaxID=297713 RepID=A0AAW0C520_9AGAR
MHYSPDRKVVVDPQGLFNRLVTNQNGSYCFGKTGLLLHMLRGLGYRVYPVQGRSNLNRGKHNVPPAFTPTTHIMLLVQPLPESNTTYMVDVGYGGSGPVRPILLREGEVVEGATPTEKHRLTRGVMPGSSSVKAYQVHMSENPAEQVWQLECLHEKEGKRNVWELVYVFDEVEKYQVDIDCSSHYVSTFDDGTMHAYSLIAVKNFWLDDSAIEHRSIGAMILAGGTLKRTMGAHSEIVKVCTTEEERVEVLREYIGETVNEAWIDNIKTRKAALRNLEKTIP